MDYTSIHPSSADQAHQIDLHLWRGPPQNLDETRPVQILVNQGYVVGFCPARLQPLWSAYRVAHSEADVDYNRPIHYHDDLRLPPELRVGRTTFGKLGNIQLNVGHMTPNEVINRQFGRLAQMETFLMSNMSPQYGSLNSGVWLKLEDSIRAIEDEDGKDHVWAIVGPVFGDQPPSINRGSLYVPVPDSYFAVVVDPFSYPYDKLTNAHIDCFIIPQNAPPSSKPQDYPASLAQIEAATRLKFFTDWGRDIPVWEEVQLAQAELGPQSRMMRVLESKAQQWQEQLKDAVAAVQPVAGSIDGLIASLEGEASALKKLQRPLSEAESARLVTIQHTISWLIAARDLPGPGATAKKAGKKKAPANFITYNIVSDVEDRLKLAARTACNFWNRFVEPSYSIVIRLGTFTQVSNTIARAYMPYDKDGVKYGRVEFNTTFLVDYTPEQIAGTVIHEIGHTLGIGWDLWDPLFDPDTGLFSPAAIGRLNLLAQMEVERDGGPGTALSHWDEARFDQELMTGYKDSGEFVLPVTIGVMALLGHQVRESLDAKTELAVLIQDSANMVFSRQDEARSLNLTYFEETDLFETVPHGPAFPPGATP